MLKASQKKLDLLQTVKINNEHFVSTHIESKDPSLKYNKIILILLHTYIQYNYFTEKGNSYLEVYALKHYIQDQFKNNLYTRSYYDEVMICP